MRNCLRHSAIAIGVAVLAVCSGGCDSTPVANSQVSPTALPSPFVITERLTPRALGLARPLSLAIGPNGNVYAMDRSQRVAVISAEGKVLQQWGKPGTGPGEFHFMGTDTSDPNGYDGKIAVGSDGEVYVPDTENSRVQVFTPDGRFVRQFGRLGSGKGQFLFLFDLAVDDTGSIYLVDAQLNMIRKLSTDGKFVWQIGGSAADDPDLIAVEGTFHLSTFDSHGRLVVANDTNGRILYLDRDGHKVDAFGRSNLFLSYIGRDLGGPCEATVDAQGDTYVSACDKGPTLVFDRAHRLVAIWPGLPDPLFRSPVFGPNGEVFALTYDGDILRLRITLPQG